MTSPSSAKKIARVQRAGTAKVAGTRRPLGFPLALMAVILIGCLAVFFARESRLASRNAQPRVGQKWRGAFAVYKCDQFIPKLDSTSGNTLGGVSWTGDYVKIEPTTPGDAGKNATLGKLFDQLGIKFNGSRATLGDGNPLNSDQKCTVTKGSEKGKEVDSELVLFQWQPKSSEKSDPKRITSDFGATRFAEDRQIFVLALVPKNTKKTCRDGVDERCVQFPNIDAMTAGASAEDTTTTVAPGGESTTVAPSESSTTVAPGPSTTAAHTGSATTTVKAATKGK
jgi:hypothetical protein